MDKIGQASACREVSVCLSALKQRSLINLLVTLDIEGPKYQGPYCYSCEILN
jgi:hypothetical protein